MSKSPGQLLKLVNPEAGPCRNDPKCLAAALVNRLDLHPKNDVLDTTSMQS